MLKDTADRLAEIPDEACPRDFAVAAITLHPQYIAKSFYPAQLLREVGLKAVGSRPTAIRPERLRKGQKTAPNDSPRPTTDLFVAGRRENLRQWAMELPRWTEERDGATQLFKIEQLRAFLAKERIAPIQAVEGELLLEVGLHLPEDFRFVLDEFEKYVEFLGLEIDTGRGFPAGGLFFVPLLASRELVPSLAQFTFLRVVREMPRLRTFPSVTRVSALSRTWSIPTAPALDPSFSVAVFDGGLGAAIDLSQWVETFDAPGVGPAMPEYEEHGAAVTSALLFGSLNGGTSPVPFSKVSHYRVLDAGSHNDPYELYDVLRRIVRILEASQHEFINLSIGPDLPVEDTEVHAWTAVLDPLIHRKAILATIAVGNSGELDKRSGNARVQVPSDCVNALSIGGSTSVSPSWKRAPYSALGPGRSPGLVKPDVLAFGGCHTEPFWVLDPAAPGRALPTMGTSFASPTALRMSAGVRAHLGHAVNALAIKALLIHTATDKGYPREEVGWGRITQSLESMLVCGDGITRVVYQGEIGSGQFVRAQVPIPEDEMPGRVEICATFCFTSETDPEDPSNYTRNGLRVIFRPHEERRDEDSANATSKPFFSKKEYETELELRNDAQKWETTLHHRKRMLGKSLKNPVFDIHCNARSHGGPGRGELLKYALIVTVSCKRKRDLYDRILQRYRTVLRPLQPQIDIPVRTRG
jgi:hypothetical protein